MSPPSKPPARGLITTHPEADVLCPLGDVNIHSVGQPVVGPGCQAELHLVPKLEQLRGPVEIHRLPLARGVHVVDSAMVSVAAVGGRRTSHTVMVAFITPREVSQG